MVPGRGGGDGARCQLVTSSPESALIGPSTFFQALCGSLKVEAQRRGFSVSKWRHNSAPCCVTNELEKKSCQGGLFCAIIKTPPFTKETARDMSRITELSEECRSYCVSSQNTEAEKIQSHFGLIRKLI